jgi:hypothetical protein
VAPDFRILLYPMRQGDPLPETAWNEKGDELTLKAGSSTDLIGIKTSADGRARVGVARDGGEKLSLP